MKKPNVVLLVIDTLRGDYAQGLEALRDLGFVEYKDAIAPAPWTLPSHASMITGLMPLQHGIHESLKTYEEGGEAMAKTARLRMNKLNYGIIGELKQEGYETAIITVNSFITPQYGFKADITALISWVCNTPWSKRLRREMEKLGLGLIGYAFRLLKQFRLRDLAYGTYCGMRYLSWLVQFVARGEKGSGHVLSRLRELTLNKPYFLLINIVEAHSPYTTLSHDLYDKAHLKAVLNNGHVDGEDLRLWRTYPKHARYAVKRALDIVKLLYSDDTLFIVTSDHGELLGDGGVFHSYFLKDGLLKVPLWVKYPNGAKPLRQKGRYVSLTEIPKIVKSIVEGEDTGLGSDMATSESFGVIYSSDSVQKLGFVADLFRNKFRRRVRVYFANGALTYDLDNGHMEEYYGDGDVATKIIKELDNLYDKNKYGNSISQK